MNVMTLGHASACVALSLGVGNEILMVGERKLIQLQKLIGAKLVVL